MSTITMQLARNLYLTPERRLSRKAKEIAAAVLLEALLSKMRILELYLNVIEWGPNVWDAKQAAQHYTAATLIAMQGHRVLLLEKHKFPIYKIGESLLPATVHGICPMLGVDKALKEAAFIVKRGGTFRWGKSEEPWTFTFGFSPKMAGPYSTAYQVERSRFDMILLDNAKEKGVVVKEGCCVREVIDNDGQHVRVAFTDEHDTEHRVTSRYLIDASGHKSAIAREVGTRIYSEFFFQNVALFGYFNGGKRLPEPNRGNILTVAFKRGWFWYIPLSESLTSVGAVIGREHAKA